MKAGYTGRYGFTVLELLVVIALLAALAAMITPVLVRAREEARQARCFSHVRQNVVAALLYAGDYDDVFPRLDNNGSCVFGESPCDTPDWGDLRLAQSGLRASERVMFFGALTPYGSDPQTRICPTIGPTNWRQAVQALFDVGDWGGPYAAEKETFYYAALGQMAVNLLVVDYGSSASTNQRPGAPHGRVAAIVRPTETILFVAESAWNWDSAIALGVGNGAVWPSSPSGKCWFDDADGWTRYVHDGERGNGMEAYGSIGRATTNPNLTGLATFAFCDGHVKPLRYIEAEKCVPIPGPNRWNLGRRGQFVQNSYYPYWVPEL